jgi:spermidine synthase
LVHDGSYESTHPSTVEPDRLIFMDGILQSRRSGDASYHESLVHPAMFSHKNPRRVAIVGGGDGAILREVLKHNTVQNVVVIEECQMVIDLIRQHLPDYIDCSPFLKGLHSCFDDPRVLLVNENPYKWFGEHTGSSATGTGSDIKPFDVVLIDEE